MEGDDAEEAILLPGADNGGLKDILEDEGIGNIADGGVGGDTDQLPLLNEGADGAIDLIPCPFLEFVVGDHAEDDAVIGFFLQDRISVMGFLPEAVDGIGWGLSGVDANGVVRHDGADGKVAPILFSAVGGHALEGDAVLNEEGVVYGDGPETVGDGVGEEVPGHEGEDEGIVLGELNDHEHGGELAADDGGEEGADAEEGAGLDGFGGEVGEKANHGPAEKAAEHAAEKEGGREDAAAAPGAEAKGGGEEFPDEEEEEGLPAESAGKAGVEVGMAGAEDALGTGKKENGEADDADPKPADGGACPFWDDFLLTEGLPPPEEVGDKKMSEEGGGDSKGNGDEHPRGGIHALEIHNEGSVVAEDAVLNDGGDDDGDDDTAKGLAAEVVEELFKNEEQGGDGGIEGGGDAGAHSDGDHGLNAGLGEAEPLSDGGGNGGANVDGGAFASEAVPAADGEGGDEEAPEAVAEWDDPEVIIISGLRLGDPASGGGGRDELKGQTDNGATENRHAEEGETRPEGVLAGTQFDEGMENAVDRELEDNADEAAADAA